MRTLYYRTNPNGFILKTKPARRGPIEEISSTEMLAMSRDIGESLLRINDHVVDIRETLKVLSAAIRKLEKIKKCELSPTPKSTTRLKRKSKKS